MKCQILQMAVAFVAFLSWFAPVPANAQPPSHDHSAMHGETKEQGPMPGLYGPYPMTREASGTAWQPDRALHTGLHGSHGAWSLMLHGVADVVFDDQGGGRGDEKVFSSSMLMGMAQRKWGPGRLGLRAMMSAEPATMGKEGYPLLLQTGETADGVTPLIDRQHPHDLFMELATSYSIPIGAGALFVYGGLPGEPALGPPAFMHRFSGMAIPAAPISHHWLDSSHITYGVITAGANHGGWKVEASAFRGREPDQDRYNIETGKLDSHSFRLSVNPTPAWALQASYGRLESPEQLEPEIDIDRTTVSAIFATDSPTAHFESTVAWGRNKKRPGPTLDAYLAEASIRLKRVHTVFARIEFAEKDELFLEGDPRHGEIFDTSSWNAGYRYDVWTTTHFVAGVGAMGSIAMVPDEIEDVYGSRPFSYLLFTHLELR